jgi:hypothetical protein
MSTPPPSRPLTPASSNSTRQLLDELDALMQRMLALPVNRTEEEGAGPVADEAPPNAESSEEASSAAPAPETAPPAPATALSAPSPVPEAGHSKEKAAPEANQGSLAAPAVLPSATGGGSPRTVLARERTRSAEPNWWLRSLLWSNRVFDQGTSWLGAPGRWLRGIWGRTLLGVLGLVLLAFALTWALGLLDNFLDWPR